MIVEWCEQAMAVTNHPYFSIEPTEYDDRTGQSLLGMFGQPRQHRLLVMLPDVCRDACHKLLTTRSLGHAGDITADQLHGIAAIGAEDAVAVVGLRRGTVNDGNEVICDDDAVLAFLLWVLRDERLFEDLHRDKVL